MTITIRPISLEDVEAFNAVVGSVAAEKRFLIFTEAPSLESSARFVAMMIENRYPQLLMCDGDEIAGWCDIVGSDRTALAHVGTLGMGLLPDYRGHGHGERLLRATLDAAAVRGFSRIQLGVFLSNTRAQGLYQKVGFVEEGIRRRAVCLHGRFEDEVMMARVTVQS